MHNTYRLAQQYSRVHHQLLCCLHIHKGSRQGSLRLVQFSTPCVLAILQQVMYANVHHCKLNAMTGMAQQVTQASGGPLYCDHTSPNEHKPEQIIRCMTDVRPGGHGTGSLPSSLGLI